MGFQRSGIDGQGGLVVGDVITKLGSCDVKDFATWVECIKYTVSNVQPGFCLSSEFIQHHDQTKHGKKKSFYKKLKLMYNFDIFLLVEHYSDGPINCCDPNTLTDLCFEYIESLSDPQELPPHSCLNVRKVAERSASFCDYANQCSSAHCYRPSIHNNTKLVVIKRQLKKYVLFLGHPVDLSYIHVTEYVPKTDYLSSNLPKSIEKFCKYLLMFAGGLAVINVIPCFYFDGEKISRVLVNTMLKNHVEHLSVRLAISLCLTLLGSLIIIIYMILGFWSLLGIIK